MIRDTPRCDQSILTGIEMLKVAPVSQAQAMQRSGRAGREQAGKCYRLYTENVYTNELEEDTIPEIQRINVSQVLLQLKMIGVESPMDFNFLSRPSSISMKKGLELLLLLSALDKDQKLTKMGKSIASLPLDPLYGYFLLKSQEFACVSEALTAVALLSTDNIFLQPHNDHEKRLASQAHRNFAISDGDLPTLINIYQTWMKAKKDKSWTSRNYLSYRALQQACSIRSQLSTLLTKIGLNPSVSCFPEKEPFMKCLAAGLFLNVAQRVEQNDGFTNSSNDQNNSKYSYTKNDNRESNSSGTVTEKELRAIKTVNFSNNMGGPTAPYKTLRGNQPVFIHPSSVLFSIMQRRRRKLPEYIVFAEILITTKQYMRNISVIDGSQLYELYPNLFKKV